MLWPSPFCERVPQCGRWVCVCCFCLHGVSRCIAPVGFFRVLQFCYCGGFPFSGGHFLYLWGCVSEGFV